MRPDGIDLTVLSLAPEEPLEANWHVPDTLLGYHHEQGLSKRRFKPEELFAPETLDSFKV